ncbi:hypothetical protein SELMODRAFT_89100 [Selaginella moellendorffii]|uniref:Pentacotripeptide-repeat region of PRORP domain-containing protein n=1 Tax=Selaginella moellendorffii TaxID=88036 RepID=D8RAU2_SELML|nr:hypothetical protein SELMODRAFT_89100 [Selaginella moellendorffii]
MPQRDVVSWTAMMATYAQAGHLDESKRMFDAMPELNFVSWSAIVTAYSQADRPAEARATFEKMSRHELISCTAMIQAYAQLGHLHKSRLELFDAMPVRDTVSWNGMIAAYARTARYKESLELFRVMELEGMEADAVTMVSILTSASHVGKMAQGVRQFRAMIQDHAIVPVVEHYHCVLDALGRAGRLEEAEELILGMPFLPDLVSWTILLSACKTHSDRARAERASKFVLLHRQALDTPYTLLSNIYAENSG